jgi:hypothetical protein
MRTLCRDGARGQALVTPSEEDHAFQVDLSRQMIITELIGSRPITIRGGSPWI